MGAHGLFLLMNEPPRERHVLKLTVHLPGGPIGVVAHGTHTSSRGLGVQFFALAGEAKRRWDSFLSDLGGQPVADAGDDVTGFSDATFVVKLRTVDALREFALHCLAAGGTYLRTPVLKAVGSSVTLTMVHPVSERELRLAGVVARLHQQRPKGMEIQFSRATLALTGAFETFLQTGEPPSLEVDLDANADLVVEVDDDGPPARDEEMAFDIDVLDDSEVLAAQLDEEHKFDWEQVSEELLIDIGLGDELGNFDLPRTDPNLRYDGRPEPLPPSQEGDDIPLDLEELARPFFQVAVRCDSCDMLETELDVGSPPGALSLVSEHQPMFCPSCRTLVTTKRLMSAGERATARTLLRERGGLELPVPVRLLLEVSDLSEPPLCPTCKTKLKHTKAVKALERVLSALERGVDPGDTRLACGVCKDGHWTVERLDPPLRIDAEEER